MKRPAYSSAIPGSLRRFPTPQAKPMPDLTQTKALLARLRAVTTTQGGDPVEALTVESDSQGTPKFIRGYVLEPTAGTQPRRQACCWMPTGKARVGGERLNIFIPEAQ